MNLKKNLFLVVWGAVIFVLLGACGFLLFKQRAAYVEAKGQLESAEQSLSSLNTRNPFPSTGNVAITETNLMVLDQLFEDFMTHLSDDQIAEKPMEGAQFLTVLEETLQRLNEHALDSQVLIPMQFAYGFDSYALGSIPATQDVPRLTVQLQMVEALSELMFTNEVTAITSITRTIFDATAANPGMGGSMMGSPFGEGMFGEMGMMGMGMDAGGLATAGALEEESHLYSVEHFTLTYAAQGASVMKVLESLAGQGVFAVVTDIRAGVGTGVGGASGMPDFATPSMGMEMGMTSDMDMGMGMGMGMGMTSDLEMGMGMGMGMPMGSPYGGDMMMDEGSYPAMGRGLPGEGGMYPGPGGAMTGPGARRGAAAAAAARKQRYLLRDDRQLVGKEILQVTMGVDVYRFKRAEEEGELDEFGGDLMGVEMEDGSEMDTTADVEAPAVEETEFSAAMAEGKSTFNDIADKLVLVLVLVLLLASSIYLLVMIGVERGKLEEGQVSLKPARPIAAELIDRNEFDQAMNQIIYGIGSGGPTNRPPLKGADRVACVNTLCHRPIPWAALVCPFCGFEQPELEKDTDDKDGDKIPDVYEKAHGMNPYNPADALLDPDRDGFTNREEYESETDPIDPGSRPPMAAKLRIMGTPQQDLIDLTFWGTQQFSADELRFQLNSAKRGRSYFVVIGDEIEGYAVDRYLPDAEKGATLILAKDGNEYELIKDESFTFGDWTANLILLLNGRQFRRMKEKTEITVEEQQYIVVDISEETVIIRNKDTGENLSVGRISPAEAQRLKLRMGGGTSRRR